MHVLGGKCIVCNDENFNSLEIDHIYGDGNNERQFYTHLNQKYLNNPVKSKQRLQLLCKKHHEEKHHLPIMLLKQLSVNIDDVQPDLFFKMLKNKASLNELYRIINRKEYDILTTLLLEIRKIFDDIIDLRKNKHGTTHVRFS